MKENSLTKNTIMSLANQMLAAIFPLITFPYVSRVLLPGMLGRVSFAQALSSYFIMIGSLGISFYGTRAIARARDDIKQLSQTAAELFVLHLALAST